MSEAMIAVQVYSMREEAEKDFKGTMQKIKQMGYDGVELAGLYEYNGVQIKAILDECGLIPISAHVSVQAFMEDLEGTAKTYHQIGCQYVGIPFLSEEQRYGSAQYQEIMEFIPVISKKLAEYGITMFYHNHDFEFEKTDKGIYVLDEIFETFSPEQLVTELDTCWVKVAGEDPVAYIKKYEGRCPVVHLKDFKKTDKVELLTLGDGEQDVKAIAKTAIACGAKWLIIEQDDHPYGTPMEDMEKSINYLKNLL